MERVVITEQEKIEIIKSAKDFLTTKEKENSIGDNSAFIKMISIANDEYCEAYGAPNELLYEMICCADIVDLVFLHSKNYGLKAKCIIECIDRENYNLASELIKKLMMLSKYKDYATEGCDDWEYSNFQTMQQVISHYPINEYAQSQTATFSDKSRAFAVDVVESMLPFLKEYSQNELYSGLMFSEKNSKYVELYINDLILTVENYTRKPRRKNGFGNVRSINDATSKITKSFSKLLRLNRTDVIREMMTIIKTAGEDLRPVNYKMFAAGILHQFGKETYEEINIK